MSQNEAIHAQVAPLFAAAFAQKVTPGAVLLVSEKGRIVFHEAFGYLLEDGPKTQVDSVYDMASITKAACTTALLLRSVARGDLSLESKAARWLPELQGAGKEHITVQHLLGHASGLPAHCNFFARIWEGERLGTPWETLVKMAGAEPLAHAPGTQAVYSDLGFILLGRLLEICTQSSLQEAFSTHIAQPLGLQNSGFGALQRSLENVAPSGDGPCPDGSRGMLHGVVHDDNTRAGGGVSGHAGLFSNAKDLARLAQSWCDAMEGKTSIFSADCLQEFWTRSAAPNTTWRMGFDTPSSQTGVSASGDRWPASGVGHMGFTGTSLWLAPKHNRFVILLTNRTYYSWEPTGIKALRRAVMDAVSSVQGWF